MIPSHNDLLVFFEISKSLNISRAAERIGLSQPSLTLTIQRLEQQIGTALLVRHKRGVTLTPAGKQLQNHTRQLIDSWEMVKSKTLASMQEVQGSLTLGLHPSVALYSLNRFLPKLLAQYPQLHIKLKHDLSRKIAEEVISSQIEIGIIINPVRHPDLILHKLGDDFVKLWTTSNPSPNQDLNSPVGTLICDPELLQTQDILKQLKKSGPPPQRLLTSNNLEVITDLTLHGAGVGIIPTRVATKWKEKGLTPYPGSPQFHDEIYLLYRLENKNVKVIQEITKEIKKIFV